MNRTESVARRACAAAVCAAALGAWPADARVGSNDPWAKGSQWISLRAGYAKSNVERAADGNVGIGFGTSRMRNSKWSWGGHAHLELLGRFGAASEIEVPLTVEVARHFQWPTVVRPYLGLGAGAFFHKTYRTGADRATVRPGQFVVGGINAPISDHSLLGIDARAVFQGSARSDDPVFPNENSNALHWSVKLNWSRLD